MQKDDKENCPVGQTRELGEEEEEKDKQEVVTVDNPPTKEVVVVDDDDDDDAEGVGYYDHPDCILVGDSDQPNESQCAAGQKREPVVEEVVIVENISSDEVVVVDDDGDDEEEAAAAFCIGQPLLETDLRKNQKILYDLQSLVVSGQQMTARVTIEGRRFAVLKMHRDVDVDIIFHSTSEGGYRGYAALMSQGEQELFLWHVVEIVRVNKDGSVMFPDKVQVPTLSLTSLIKFGGCAGTSNSQDSGRLLCANHSPTSELLPRRLYDKAVEALGNPLRSKLATASAYFEKADGLESYLDTRLFADWNDRRFTKAIIKRVREAETHERKRKMEKEEEGEPSNSKKGKIEVLLLD